MQKLKLHCPVDKPTLDALLTHLIAQWECEVVEFKQASKDFVTDKIGRYFSAMANEANLRLQESIVDPEFETKI